MKEKSPNINPPSNYPMIDNYPVVTVNNQLSKSFRSTLLAASLFSLVVSVYFWVTGDKETSIYTLIWVPSILSLGNLLEN